MTIHENIAQGSPKWFAIRNFKMTASHAQAIGNCGKGLDTYILELMAESHSTSLEGKFSSKDTERGNELEPLARNAYEMEIGKVVKQVGFIELDEFTGCSPDGLIDENGGTEFKALNDIKHYSLLVKGESEIESKYLWQCQMCMYITGREYWDLCFYNPNFKTSLKVFRQLPDKEKFEGLEKGLAIGKEQIIRLKEIY